MKVNRHAKIIELIGKYHIETQEELADYLNREGFKVTQATVSRDIRDLKLTKIPAENGKQKYALHQESGNGMSEKYIRVLRDGYMSMVRHRIFWSSRRWLEWRWLYAWLLML